MQRGNDANSKLFGLCGRFWHVVSQPELQIRSLHLVQVIPWRITAWLWSTYAISVHVVYYIGGRSSEDVILQLIHSKCMPALLHGLEACSLRSSDNNSLDFVIHRKNRPCRSFKDPQEVESETGAHTSSRRETPSFYFIYFFLFPISIHIEQQGLLSRTSDLHTSQHSANSSAEIIDY